MSQEGVLGPLGSALMLLLTLVSSFHNNSAVPAVRSDLMMSAGVYDQTGHVTFSVM